MIKLYGIRIEALDARPLMNRFILFEQNFMRC